MNVLSLFDGISCGRVALERAGIDVTTYVASEIDKYAIQVSQKNHPDIVHVGDVADLSAKDLSCDIDLLIGGSPCQGFSFAGKQLNFDDPRSALLFEYVRLLEECEPKWFLLENVRMKKEYQDVISGILGVEPHRINSSLVSAQNRDRLYWTNIPLDSPIEDQGIVGVDFTGQFLDLGRKLNRDVVWRRRSGVLDCLGYYGKNSTSQRVYGVHGKLPTLLVNNTGGNNPLWLSLDESEAYRASIHFCEWLQTLPEDYTSGIPDNQRYRTLGNGWTIDVLVSFFRNLRQEQV